MGLQHLGKVLEDFELSLKEWKRLSYAERNRKTIVSLISVDISKVPGSQQSHLRKQWLKMQLLESRRPKMEPSCPTLCDLGQAI